MLRRAEVAAAVVVISLLTKQTRRKRRWVKSWLANREKHSGILRRELSHNDSNDYRNCLRMDDGTFQELLTLVAPLITKENTIMRSAITAEERLVATLRYLATGKSLEDLKFSCAISAQSLGHIIPETCRAIYEVLQQQYFKFPQNEDEWRQVAIDFDLLWNFPNCGGALAGKHVQIVPPPNSGSQYYNYKCTFSVILMALVNANCDFIMIDVGTNGNVSDGGAIEKTNFYKKLIGGSLNLPPKCTIKGGFNFVFVGDEAFALHENVMKPYSQEELTFEERIFNYRLSRCQRTAENAFGIMASRFKVFHVPITLRVDKVNAVIMACCALHNFLRHRSRMLYIPGNTLDRECIKTSTLEEGSWRREVQHLIPLQNEHSRNSTAKAEQVRMEYTSYFMGPGKVPWQDNVTFQQT